MGTLTTKAMEPKDANPVKSSRAAVPWTRAEGAGATSKEIKIIFWGTPEFSLPSLEGLIKNGYDVIAVVTNPDEARGRKQILTPTPIKITAEKYGIPAYQPKNLKSDFPREIQLLEADLYVVAAYGKIIPREILEIPKLGALNIHPSLLPRWRGPSPIQYTILHGDTETGVTIIKMDELMDHGPIVAVKLLKSDFNLLKSDFPTLHNELAKLGAELLMETLPKYLAGEITPTPQDESKATYSKILKREDGRIDWKKSAEEIERMIRAFNPWPGTWTTLPTDKNPRIKIEEADIADGKSPIASPGFLFSSERYPLLVKTGRGSLAVKKLILEGKKEITDENFQRGYRQFYNLVLM